MEGSGYISKSQLFPSGLGGEMSSLEAHKNKKDAGKARQGVRKST